MKTIYLDLDGVCTNFIASCIEANNFNVGETIEMWKREHLGVFNASEVLNISNTTFWNCIELKGESFWSDMEPYDWFMDLYTQLSKIGKVYFLTAPSQDPCSLSGKLKWLQKQFGKGFKEYIITPNKELLANENSYLIDDYPKNVDKFNLAGGNGILFPQFWNSTEDIKDKIVFVIENIL